MVTNSRKMALFAVRHGLFLALGLWIVIMSFTSEHFFTLYNFLNVARQASPVVIIAVGMTFVIATAGIDLSVGSLVALISVICASLINSGLPIEFGIVFTLLIGAAAGLVNGYFVLLGLPAFVVTLAALTYLRGIAFVYSIGYATPIKSEIFNWLGRGWIGGIPVPIIIAAIVAVIGWFVLNRTRFGVYCLAIGGREEAAHAMGINVGRIKLVVYTATGLLAALSGMVISARLSNGSPNTGMMLELDVIAATVLGGTSLFGGTATVGGTIAGALFINVVRNSLNLMGVYPYWVQVVTGIVLLIAILLNTVVNRRVEEWARTSDIDIQEVGLDKDDGREGN
jgi:inositol transport system permease protein